jgi:hypothetical protein
VGSVMIGTVLTAAPAQAGNWAVTYLDPLPPRIEKGRTYTIGYWVLQHGTHPFEGDLGRTALLLTDGKGATMRFPGVALREPGHYATAWSIPRAGTWTIEGVQGIFENYKVGTLTVPGGLALAPPPTGGPLGDRTDYWDAIRPPIQVPTRAAPAVRPAPLSPTAAANATRQQPGSDGAPLPAALVLAGAAALLLLFGGFAIQRRRTRRPGG